MIEQTIGFAAQNWQVVGPLAVVGVVTYWWLDERDEYDDAPDTIRKVGNRAENAVEGTMGTVTALLGVLAMVFVAFGSQIAQMLAAVADPLLSAPLATGQFFTGLLGALGLSGALNLSGGQFLLIALVILGVGAALKYRN